MPNPTPVDKLSRDEELRALPQRLLQIADDLDTVDESTVQQEVRALATHTAEILARHDAQGEAVAWARSDADGIVAVEIVRGVNGCNEPLGYLHPAPASTSKRDAVVTDERKAAEQEYTVTAFDYVRDPVGSHDWELYWKGWQARAAFTAALAAKEAV